MSARAGAKWYQKMTPAGSTETIAYGVLVNRRGIRQPMVSTSAPKGYLPAAIVEKMRQRGEIMARAPGKDMHGEERIMEHADATRRAAAAARDAGEPVPEEWWVETIGAGNPIDRDRCAPKMAAAGIERATEIESVEHAEQRRTAERQGMRVNSAPQTPAADSPSAARGEHSARLPSGSDAHRQWQQHRRGQEPRR